MLSRRWRLRNPLTDRGEGNVGIPGPRAYPLGFGCLQAAWSRAMRRCRGRQPLASGGSGLPVPRAPPIGDRREVTAVRVRVAVTGLAILTGLATLGTRRGSRQGPEGYLGPPVRVAPFSPVTPPGHR